MASRAQSTACSRDQTLQSLHLHLEGGSETDHHHPADAGDSADGGVNLILVLFSLCARISGTMTPFADAGDSADGGVTLILVLLSLCAIVVLT